MSKIEKDIIILLDEIVESYSYHHPDRWEWCDKKGWQVIPLVVSSINTDAFDRILKEAKKVQPKKQVR